MIVHLNKRQAKVNNPVEAFKNIPNIEEIFRGEIKPDSIVPNKIVSPMHDRALKVQNFNLPQPPLRNKELVQPF